MNKYIVIILAVHLILLSPSASALEMNNDADALLTSAESLFKFMQQKNYSQIWKYLSQKSRDTIVQDTYKALKPIAGDYSEENIGKDFIGGGLLSSAYWNAFLNNFDPIMILEQSRWEIESIKSDKAEIKITYKKAENPAILKMFKEDGMWKVGLTESFWTRK
jgi:hypothetical protein